MEALKHALERILKAIMEGAETIEGIVGSIGLLFGV
jgi:hypothetical protein